MEVASAFLKRPWLLVFIEALAVYRPAIEAARAAIDFSKCQRNGFDEPGDGPALAEHGVMPRFVLGLDPSGRASVARVFNDDVHTVPPVVVWGSQHPYSSIFHLGYRQKALFDLCAARVVKSTEELFRIG